MLLTSSGERELAEGVGVVGVSAADSAAAAWAATMPGARLARGTRRGRPALVVGTEADGKPAGASEGSSAGGRAARPAARPPRAGGGRGQGRAAGGGGP